MKVLVQVLCLAALRWHGYRAGNRYIVFQVLPHTLGLGPEVWRVLVDKVVARFGEDLQRCRFALWGLAFKPKPTTCATHRVG